MKSTIFYSIVFIAFLSSILYSCSKEGGGTANPCAGITVTVDGTTTDADPSTNNGAISATSTGGSGAMTFNIDGGSFQASGNFTGLAKGVHTVIAKDSKGCTGSKSFTVGEKNPCAGTAGPLFTAVKSVVTANCAVPGCHAGTSPTGGLNLTVECNIVLNKDRIKSRAVDGTPSIMPPSGSIGQADKDKITAWINAGGKFTD